jgi:hypothetical protein
VAVEALANSGELSYCIQNSELWMLYAEQVTLG